MRRLIVTIALSLFFLSAQDVSAQAQTEFLVTTLTANPEVLDTGQMAVVSVTKVSPATHGLANGYLTTFIGCPQAVEVAVATYFPNKSTRRALITIPDKGFAWVISVLDIGATPVGFNPTVWANNPGASVHSISYPSYNQSNCYAGGKQGFDGIDPTSKEILNWNQLAELLNDKQKRQQWLNQNLPTGSQAVIVTDNAEFDPQLDALSRQVSNEVVLYHFGRRISLTDIAPTVLAAIFLTLFFWAVRRVRQRA